MTDMAARPLWNKVAPHGTGNPLIPSAYKSLDLKQRVGTPKTKDQTQKAKKI